ncbi:MAG: hypothetical protein ACFFG0_49750, partial [Candidatus Thorarchaeota archaeon]
TEGDIYKILVRFFFFSSGSISVFVALRNLFSINSFGDSFVILLPLAFFLQMTPFLAERMIIKKDSKNTSKNLLLISCILLAYALLLILVIFPPFSYNNTLVTFGLLIFMISIGCLNIFVAFKKKENFLFCRIILGIEFIILLSLSLVTFIMTFLDHYPLMFFFSIGLLLGGISNLLYGIIWKFKND